VGRIQRGRGAVFSFRLPAAETSDHPNTIGAAKRGAVD
jgi:hypothetical protein